MREKIVICMPVKNAEKSIERSIRSVMEQVNIKREVILLIGNDNSSDGTLEIVNKLLPNPNIKVLEVDHGKTYANRNFLNNYARQNYPDCCLIGRLDADDIVFDKFTLSKIEKIYEKYDFDVLICGNKQSRNGEILEWQNKPSELFFNEDYLLERLRKMSEGDPKAELPSCNTFIKPSLNIDYPAKDSAEDHWFTMLIMAKKNEIRIHVDPDLIYSVYSLDGSITKINKTENNYLRARKELYDFFSTVIITR